MIKNILFVEDYPSLQSIYQNLLTLKGYHVDLAQDGSQALVMANQTEYALILLDLLTPNLNGLDFLRAYDLASHPGLKVIVFSNLGDTETIEEARALGASRYLTKATITPKEVVAVIEEVLAEEMEPEVSHS
jgi:DNA-binding response OmpR family regulator